MQQEEATKENNFFTPAQFAQEQSQRIESPRGQLRIASCRSAAPLAASVVERYQARLDSANGQRKIPHLKDIDYNFSDSETGVRLETDVSGDDLFLVQALYDPTSPRSVDQNYMAFLIAARTFREWGANCITAVLPYLAYARQDKPTKFKREPTTAKLMADLSAEAGINRLVVWHPHYSQIHGFYGRIPVDVLEALGLFVEQFRPFQNRDDVIAVAPDAGASKFVTHFSRALNLKSAIASKYRPHPEETIVTQVIGEFSGKKIAIVLDDMISSGGTVYALVKKLVQEKGIKEVYLGVSHNLCMDQARQRMSELHQTYRLKKLIVTNSIPQTDAFLSLPFVEVKDLADTLSQVINRIHYNRAVSSLFY